MELPLQLQIAIENELKKFMGPLWSINKLAALVGELSKSYRTGAIFDSEKYLSSREGVAAYAAFRLPATFAAIYSTLNQIRDRCQNWSPKTLLDVGAGPGTAMWAATTLWPELEHITLLEREEHMMDFGKRLSLYSSLTSIKEAKWIKTDITGTWRISPHDMVIASYVLNELPQDSISAFIRRLWESTKDMLIIIEPGTPAGFWRIRRVREQLLAEGAKTIAPCPHDKLCPMTESDWCHFAQRIARSQLHRMVKAGELSYEDEKFSYLCMSRLFYMNEAVGMGESTIKGVVIRHPQIRKGHIRLELCTPEGLISTVITRKDKEQFRKARELHWGSVIR